MGFVYSVVNSLVSGLSTVAITVLSILPSSPLKLSNMIFDNQILRGLNYFIPISEMITIGTSWVSCIAIWYVVQIVLRWAKAIE